MCYIRRPSLFVLRQGKVNISMLDCADMIPTPGVGPSLPGPPPARRRSLGNLPPRPHAPIDPEDFAGRRSSHGPGQFLQKVRDKTPVSNLYNSSLPRPLIGKGYADSLLDDGCIARRISARMECSLRAIIRHWKIALLPLPLVDFGCE